MQISKKISEKSKKEIESLFLKRCTLENNSVAFLICEALYLSPCAPKQLIQKLIQKIKIHSLQKRIHSLQKRKLIRSADGLLELTDTGRWLYVASKLGLRISSLFLLSHVYVTQKKLEKICDGFCPVAQFKDIAQYSYYLPTIIRNLRESEFIYRYSKRCVRIYPYKMQILEKYDYEFDSLNRCLLGLRSDIENIVNHDEVAKANFIRICKLFADLRVEIQ